MPRSDRTRRDLWRVPTSTYRVQLHAGFTLDDAAALVPALVDLGVSHLYCSPYLASAPGSTHGYDVVDHSRVDDEVGGPAAHARLTAALGGAGLGQVLDIVPNHMTVATRDNAAWWDVLAQGPDSDYASWFDVDWDRHGGRVLLPVLGDPLPEVLARGDLVVEAEAGGLVIRYFDRVFPVSPTSEVAAVAGSPATTDLLADQHYLLAHWRDAPHGLNYRRFFDVTTLAGLRVEDPDVFAATHELVLEWARSGVLDGIRVDHPDGLADPAAYLDRLSTEAPGTWVLVEKILEPGEPLPDWPVDGTTGYDALTEVQQVLVDPGAEPELTRLYGELTGAQTDYLTVVRDAKRHVLREVLVPEVDRLVRLVTVLAAKDGATARASREGVGDTVRALLAAYDVYRTYVTYEHGASDADREHLEAAVRAARAASPAPDDAVLDLLRRVLLAEDGARGDVEHELLMRWQQTTGPAMAKGVEDTAFYRYHRLVALNEVGGDPGVVGRSVSEFHDACTRAQRDWPLRMTTLTTHDTKRSEDARARLIALAETPELWARFAQRWFERHARHFGNGRVDRDTGYLLCQTLVAAHPLSAERATAYLAKATREAKQRTSWTDPDPAYDDAVRALVVDAVTDAGTQRDLTELLGEVDPAARAVSLSAKLLQLTMPGVPDVYQGSELWDHSLVDPDNRRPVDHAGTAALLADLDALSPGEIAARAGEGLTKLHVVRSGLRLRRERPEAFGTDGDYRPLRADGPLAEHCVAFCRGDSVVTVATRLPRAVDAGWSGTTLALPDGSWRDLLTGRATSGGHQPLDELVGSFPVALLAREVEA
ncbi:MAG TPA: malto-oligosyltrehalose synthase [Mycobacteriales bacterium]|nr:malto-oligosyltrehalose synthase [Mycobacteriales bacterium]